VASDIPQSLADFAGRWKLTRKIIQRNGDVFTFNGEAEFSWRSSVYKEAKGSVDFEANESARKSCSNTVLAYIEQGEVIAPTGNVMLAERRYFWLQPQPGVFEVLFDDSRYFHTFSALHPNAEHLCGEDNYVVRYNFDKWPMWRSTWEVIGPRKDYIMHSEFTPA